MIEKYRVSGKAGVVGAITDALRSCGVRIIKEPTLSEAPFQYEVILPSGEALELVCYAFLANKYGQRGRPPDEHRFQVKYGNKFDRPHDLFVDPNRRAITLFIGVHLEAGVFVGADPAMHTPTWFSSSMEFKTSRIEEAVSRGWTGWERERSAARRRTGRDLENYQTETLIAFAPSHMLRYIELERVATGIDAGERLLLAEKMMPTGMALHPLERQFGLSPQEIMDVIWGRFRLGVAVRGGVAEHQLGKHLRAQNGISSVAEIDEDGKPDFRIVYRDRPFLVECKNTLRRVPRDGKPRVDFQKTRAAKGNPCSRYYDAQSFDVLAACLHPVTERWEFIFANTRTLDAHKDCSGKLSARVLVDGARWHADIRAALDLPIRPTR